ncbi:MAG: M48 family metallopeptidase [Candidatus Riflebacteria bacterium]|nr:M48 family metallopeptidase [Candidatus Riflebacteria bacterium]
MKKKTFLLALTVLMLLVVSNDCFAGSKNVLKQIFKIYQGYEEANMLLWLTGDVGAEKRLGKELAMWQKLTSRQEGDQAKVDRVMRIFNKLAPQYNTHGMKLKCTVLHDSTVNAFAIPGGNVYVYSGIVDFLQSDDELAAVIAHELAHVEKRHSLKNYRASAALTALLQKAVKNQKNKDLWCAVLSSLALMKFSQKQEDEADDVGQFKLAAAGFNPYGQVHVWERFLKKYGDSKGLEKFLSSHPSHKARIENAKKNIAKMNYQVPDTEIQNPSTASQQSSSAIPEPTPAPRASTKQQEQPRSVQNFSNLVLDGGFERGYTSDNKLEYWDVSEGLFKLSNKVFLNGKYSLEGSANGSFVKSRILSNFIAVDQYSNLTLKVCVKTETGKQVGAIGVELYDKNKRLRNRVWAKEMMAFPNNWNQIEARLVNTPEIKLFSPSIAYIRVLLQAGPNTSGNIWFDDVSVTKN